MPLIVPLLLAAAVAAEPRDRPLPLAYGGGWHGRTLTWTRSDPWLTAGVGLIIAPAALAFPVPDVTGLEPGTAHIGDRIDEWGPFSMTLSMNPTWAAFSDVLGYGTGFGMLAFLVPYEIAGDGAWRRDLGRAGIAFQAVTLNLAVTDLLKKGVGRPRPFTHLDPEQLRDSSDYGAATADKYYAVDADGRVTGFKNADAIFSWPSGHTSGVAAGAFTITTIAVLSKADRRPVDFAWYAVPTALTVLEGQARVRASFHHPTDVISGAILGAACGILVPAAHLRRVPADYPGQIYVTNDGVGYAGRW